MQYCHKTHIQRSSLAYFLGESTNNRPCTRCQACTNEAWHQPSYSLPDTINEQYLDSDSDESDLDIDSVEEYEPTPQPINII